MLLLMLLLSCGSLQANAKPLTFHGLDWSMSTIEMLSVFEAREYTCDNPVKESPLGSIWICNGDFEGNIQLTNNWIRFPCDSWNGCIFSTPDILEKFEERYKIKPLYTHYKLPDGKIAEYYWLLKGEDGDFIELFTHELPEFNHVVRFHRGTFGEKLDF